MTDKKQVGRPPADPIGDSIIAEIRRVSGMTRPELAEKMGVAPASIQRWEAGKRAIAGATLMLATKILEDEKEKRKHRNNQKLCE